MAPGPASLIQVVRKWSLSWRQPEQLPDGFAYRAFLSYSHRDTASGKWLHAALEGYRIDKDLATQKQRPGGCTSQGASC